MRARRMVGVLQHADRHVGQPPPVAAEILGQFLDGRIVAAEYVEDRHALVRQRLHCPSHAPHTGRHARELTEHGFQRCQSATQHPRADASACCITRASVAGGYRMFSGT